MSMQDYLFFSYAKRVKESTFRIRAERKKGLILTQGFNVNPATNSFFESEKFRSEFGPSFDCFELLSPNQLFIGQYIRRDHNEKKTYALVTFDSTTQEFKSQYLQHHTPIEGRFYRRKVNGGTCDLHVGETMIHVRSLVAGKETLVSRELKQIDYDYTAPDEQKKQTLYTKRCSTKTPRLPQFLLHYFVYLSEDDSLCFFDLVSRQVSVVAVEVDYFLVPQPGYLLLFSRSTCFLLVVDSVDLPTKVKEYMWNIQNIERTGQQMTDEMKYAQEEDLMKKGLYKNISAAPMSKTGICISEQQIVTHLQEHEGIVYLALYDTKKKANSVQVLKFTSEYFKKSAFYSLNLQVLRHQLVTIGTQTLENNHHTTPITLSKPFKSTLTGNDIKVCLFFENAQYHLLFLYGKTPGRILMNKYIGKSADDEIYGFICPSVFSVVLYGWNICHELKISF